MYLSPIPESRLTDGDWDNLVKEAIEIVSPPGFKITWDIGSITQHPFHIISQAEIIAKNAIQAEEDKAIFEAISGALGLHG